MNKIFVLLFLLCPRYSSIQMRAAIFIPGTIEGSIGVLLFDTSG